MINLEDLKKLALDASPGKWAWWTSNSVKRITARIDHRHEQDGGVLRAYAHAGHADISISQNDMDYIEAAQPLTILELISTIDALKERLAEIRDAMRERRI